MKILLVTPSLPWPPHQGGAIRYLGLMTGLQRAGHRLTLLSVGPEPEADSPLFELCEHIATAPAPERSMARRLRDMLLTRMPDLALRLVSDELRSRLEEVLDRERFDLVQFAGLEVCALLPLAQQLRPGLPCCHDAFNAEFRLQQNLFHVERRRVKRLPAAFWSWVQARRIRDFERMICERAAGTLAVSGEDALALQELAPSRPVAVVPNGIIAADYDGVRHHRNSAPTLVFTGKMDYRPNVDAMLWFCSRVLPLVREQKPDCRLQIVGQSPHARVLKLDALDLIQVTGRVESIQPWLQGCDVYVAPLRMGSGTRLKILEAMACGCAIVATPLAASGLSPALKQSMRIAADESAMAGAIVDLLDDPQERRRMGESASAIVRETSDWSAILPRLLAAWESFGI